MSRSDYSDPKLIDPVKPGPLPLCPRLAGYNPSRNKRSWSHLSVVRAAPPSPITKPMLSEVEEEELSEDLDKALQEGVR